MKRERTAVLATASEPHKVVGKGLRAQYPDAQVTDALSYLEFRSVTEIADLLGGTVKEVQKVLTHLDRRGHLVMQGRKYKLG